MVFLKAKDVAVNVPRCWQHAVNVAMNDVKQGLLHSFIRHHWQWEAALPKLSTIKNQLPDSIQDLIKAISTLPLHSLKRVNAENNMVTALSNPSSEVKNALCTAQALMHEFLQKHLPASTNVVIAQNKKGQKQARIVVPSTQGPRTLVIATNNASPKARSKASMVESITTMYFERNSKSKKQYKF
uniref:DRBM domain-containing protein n=1 Tax=Panagrellus redivivus TaxID=6233 RepID=A0A7E4VMF9_PANRE